ncbi:glycosyltransferase family 57 protein [[Candida] arabinofermentans NRRL YB-2248]|uniref:Alpha-1,3-glucosyltransferase n=1 Tax=[Candida] arabinofermentans NRRL YB-2248 TaxID=983967 RepID=A0A1E4T1H3_9ASCO|nr:glycosyltransferase family 57 protein [[Candida] arabinofermentans NRRL YB-2248]
MVPKPLIKRSSSVNPDPQQKTQYNFSLWNIWVATTLLKILLYPAYHSTDFDVHRNWLSITSLLPVSDWYLENTNQWTLDYPPFFAYFEWFIGLFVPHVVVDDGCLELVDVGRYGHLTVYFQRSSVIVSEIVLFLALQRFINISRSLKEKKRNFVIASSIVLSPGLMIVDHIHFQYNGFLFGILILSITNAKTKNYLWCGFWFAVLLCFKHIFLYIAPAYFVFLFSAYCLNPLTIPKSTKELIGFIRWENLLKLGSVVIAVFVVAFAPFVYYGVLPQLLSRLFPFSRGLTHAYWAPNIWAVYSFMDRVLIQLVSKVPGFGEFVHLVFKLNISSESVNHTSSLTRGLVGDVQFSILPDIKPNHTFLLTVFYQAMSLIPLLVNPSFERFIASMTLCAWASFLFGWHVHEKAIMLVIIPFSFIVAQDRKLLPLFQILSASGYVSLFPLLFGSAEWLFKALFTFVWFVVFSTSFNEVSHFSTTLARRVFIIDRLNSLYIVALIPMCCFVQMLEIQSRNFEILQRLEFVRLMIYSMTCCIGVISSWNGFTWLYFLDDSIWVEKDD